MLLVKNLSLRAGQFELKNINFSVERGEYFVILGMSGVGKSLLLEALSGLLKPAAGEILLRGRPSRLEKIQDRNISIVYQDAGLFPHLTVWGNIAYPLKSRQEKRIEEKVRAAAEQTGIADKLDRKPMTLSGGECQRVALARGLAAGCDLFLMDEPLSALDVKSKSELLMLLRKINRDGITIIHVTHNYEEAISLASKIGIMERGEMVHVAPPEEIFKHPKSEFIAHFVGIKNYLRGTVRSIAGSDLKEFFSNGVRILFLAEATEGEAHLMVRPDEITIAVTREESSRRNHFRGKIIDIAPAKLGVEVTVDVGVELVSTISAESRRALGLEVGKEVWASFKASSCKIYA